MRQSPAPQRPAPGATVTVSQFNFVGNTLLSAEQLNASVQSYLHRALDFSQLQDAAFAVATAYRQAGWIVRTYLPAQDVQHGSVTIQVVESVFAGATVSGTAEGRVPQHRVIDILQAVLPKGAPLNAQALDRALLLMDDLPGVSVTGRLTEGQAERETGVALTMVDEPLFTGVAGLDNQGSRSTGPARLAFSGQINSPLGLADQLQVNAYATEGSDYARLGYSVPAGTVGWRLGVNASQLKYRLVAPEFVTPTDLQGRGSSSATGLEATYPILRARQKNVYLTLNYDARRFDNELNGVITTRYKSDAIMLGLSGNAFDAFGGGGVSGVSIAYTAGQLNLDGSPNQASDTATTQAAGSFGKLRYAISRKQAMFGPLALRAALSGQVAGKNLDSSEHFYLGGPSGVRAYPSSEGGGADGTIFNLDLLWRLGQGITVGAFYDYGEVQVNHNNSYTGSLALNKYSLRGAGLSLAWLGPRGTAVSATWAQRIGNNPNATAAGNDQDGSLVRDRVWLEATLTF